MSKIKSSVKVAIQSQQGLDELKASVSQIFGEGHWTSPREQDRDLTSCNLSSKE